MYEYRARVVKIKDGDTVVLDVDLCLHVVREKETFRLARINAPELGTPEGDAAKRHLEALLAGVERVLIQTKKPEGDTEKYGRFLVEIFFPNDPEAISDKMVKAGHASYQRY